MATIGVEVIDAAVIAVKNGVRLAPGLPALATDRVWSDLAGESQTRAGVEVSHSDLAHAHLAELWRAIATDGDEAAFAVPGTMRPPQIGVLLGIARHIGIPVAGVVDSAVAACAGLAARTTVLHLDVQLYQAVLTELQGTSLLRRRRVEAAPRAGQKAMYSAWAQLVAEAMVRRTRFDPLHQAATEQQVYERLPEWLAALSARESVDAIVESDGGSFTATVRREQFTLAAEAWYAQLSELVRAGRKADEPATLVLSARAAQLPMLADRLGALPGLDVIVLPDTAAAAAAAARAADLGPAEPPALVTALARSHAAAGGERRRRTDVAATHVILEGRAHAIGDEPLVVGFGEGEGRRIGLAGAAAGISRRHCTLLRERGRAIVRDHSRYGTFVNGERVDGEMELGAGDRLRVGTPGIVLELVKVG
jgi:hypothetical protein